MREFIRLRRRLMQSRRPTVDDRFVENIYGTPGAIRVLQLSHLNRGGF
ncbi:MAG: hypothetical protein KDA79_00605 [Planctomycetaceae bacterium]|nr:hypothetical protein [Planctomycetaceae bacterium]